MRMKLRRVGVVADVIVSSQAEVGGIGQGVGEVPHQTVTLEMNILPRWGDGWTCKSTSNFGDIFGATAAAEPAMRSPDPSKQLSDRAKAPIRPRCWAVSALKVCCDAVTASFREQSP